MKRLEQISSLSRSVGGLLVACALITGATGGIAAAQQNMSITTRIGGGGPGAGGMVAKRSVEKYAELLSLTPEQKEAAMTVHSGYAAAYEGKQKAMRDAMEDMRRTADDAGDQSVFMEKMPKIQKEFRDGTEKIEKELFSDLRAIVSGSKQEEAWGKVERMRRREVGLRQGTLSGESVDLIDVVGAMKLEGEAAKAASLALESYEADMDRLMQARLAKKDSEPTWEPGKPIDMEKIQEMMKESREAGMKVRDLNRDNARKIQGLLPDDKKESFADAVKRQTYPRVYRTPRVMKEADAAMKLGDLDASQKEQIADVRASYEKEAQEVNERLAKAIEESESSGQQGGTAGGMTMMFGEEPEALKDARKVRRELDEKASTKLKSILTPGQKEKLPKTYEGDDEGQGGGPGMTGRMMIRTSDR